MHEHILESAYALGCRDLACFFSRIFCVICFVSLLSQACCYLSKWTIMIMALAAVWWLRYVQSQWSCTLHTSFVVTCSSFKFPPTALDEETSENFRDRESQVHDHLLQLWCYLTSKDCLHSVFPDFLCLSILCFTVFLCFCTWQRYYVYLSGCLSVNTYFTWCDISVLCGRISE